MRTLCQLSGLPANLQLESWRFDDADERITLVVVSQQQTADCLSCFVPAFRIHSHYERTLADLPCGECAVNWKIQVRKFFCTNSQCKQKIFAERLTLAAAWARKTNRLIERLNAVALALGGEAASRLGVQLGLVACGATLLRLLSCLPLDKPQTPKILGVDDFAFRRCHTYGTILVDLERHCPIALLSNREASSLADWLQKHPGVEVLSRDRSNIYKSGMSEGAPHAIQVADRFHLIQNLAEALERTMETQLGSIKAAEAAHLLARAEKLGIPLAVRPSKSLANTEKEGESEYKVKRRELHRKIWELFNEGWSTSAIAHELGVKVRLVQRDLTRPAYFNNRGQSGKKLLDHHRAFIIELWKSGTRSHTKLLRVLKEKGYEVSTKTLYRFLKSLLHKGYLPPKRNIHQLVLPDSELRRPALTPKRAAWLVLRNQLEVDEQELLGHLREQNVHLRTAVEVGEGFARLLRQRLSEQFDEWLKVAENCSLEPLQRFAIGLRGDYDAVKAAMTLSVSNGQVEGQVNRLKMLKRQMYGRASLELLRRRFLLPAIK